MIKHIVSAIVLLQCAASAFAAAPAEPKIYKITPEAIPGSIHVKGAAYTGTTEATGTRFVLANLNTRQPVVVSVIGVDPNDEFSLAIFKEADVWKAPKREAKTIDGKPAVAMFRTYDRAHILVTSSVAARAFEIRVAVGDEIVPRAKPAFMPMDQYQQKHPMAWFSWRSPVLWAGGVTLVLLAAVALFFSRRRRAS